MRQAVGDVLGDMLGGIGHGAQPGAAAVDRPIGQMPQIRGVITRTSRGSRPCNITANQRQSGALTLASAR